MRALFYIILFMFAYRILKKLFLPVYEDASNQSNKQSNQTTKQGNQYQNYSRTTKSNDIEDVDYEEVD